MGLAVGPRLGKFNRESGLEPLSSHGTCRSVEPFGVDYSRGFFYPEIHP